MAYTEVGTDGWDSTQSKPYFKWSGVRCVYGIGIPAYRASPDGGYPMLSEYVGMRTMGDTQRFYLSDGGGGNMVASGAINPTDSIANNTSARTYYQLGVTKAIVNSVYEIGAISDTTNGVGYHSTSSGGTTYYRRLSDNSQVATWGGRMAAKLGLNIIPAAPGTPTATPGDNPGEVKLSWAAPGDNGGTAVNGYRIQWSTNDFASVLGSIADTNSTATTRTITGLTEDQELRFRVAARNAVSDAFSSTVHSGPFSAASAVVTVPSDTGILHVFNGTGSDEARMSVYDGTSSPETKLFVFDGTNSIELG